MKSYWNDFPVFLLQTEECFQKNWNKLNILSNFFTFVLSNMVFIMKWSKYPRHQHNQTHKKS